MTSVLSNISDALGPVAFVMGVLVVYTCFRRRNPFTFVIGFVIACYQVRTLLGSVSVFLYGDALIRPSGLLAWAIAGRLLEIAGSTVGWLYLSGKMEFQGVLGWLLTQQEMAQSAMTAGDYSAEFWIEKYYENSVKAINDRIKPEYLND